MTFLLDTHVWIWWNSKPKALSPRVLKLIQDAQYDELLLSSISVWEVSKLLEKKRLTFACDGRDWIQAALDIPSLRVVELSPEISWQSTQLPQPFHDDPADQIIVATARVEKAVILTADLLIRKYPHVRSEW
ncbi:type II toxin-antitoxin system VapC family toxin [Bdellovibrionota bacterium FG-2]